MENSFGCRAAKDTNHKHERCPGKFASQGHSNAGIHMTQPTQMTDQKLYRASHENFHVLSRDEQVRAIRKMAAQDFGDHSIAHATGLSVELVRQILTDAVA